MAARKETEFLVVGHYAHDTLVGQGTGEGCHALGGSSAYISSVLEALEADYSVVAKVGGDFKYLREVRRAPIVDRRSGTTAFVNDYSHGQRRQIIEATCSPISPEDIRDDGKIGLACGVFNEILPETLLHLREACDVLMGDVQGFIRFRRHDGSVGHANLMDTAYADLLEDLDFLKVSQEELRFVHLETLRGRVQVVVTQGNDGCTVYSKTGSFFAPGYEATIKDTTGAGDCFLGGFAYGICKGLGPYRAARLGNFCGALAVQQIGVPRLTREDFGPIQAELLHATRIGKT